MSRKKTKYKLYLMPTTAENIKTVQDKRFYRINPEYILLYQEYSPSILYNTIEEKDVFRLNKNEASWLRDCNMVIIAEETRKQRDNIEKSISKKLVQLESALEKEQKKINSNKDYGK